MILSDGLDYYIEYLLAKRGLSHIPYRSNGIRFREDGSLEAVFPHIEHGCGLCGNCKRYHIDTLREYGETVIYAGDGYSDRFAIRSSDVVFARDDLAEYCTTHDREFIPFDDFYTIKQYIERVHT
jgi:2-hydroxy-3-keto-5-methylthiopentenyl-1-phosphate phosphatase